jgi:branched-chain amino acid transport system permease protein
VLPDLATAGQLAVSGLTIGCVYSLVGLGFALTLRATDLINFAQGEMVMLGAFIGLSVLTLTGLPYAAAFLAALIVAGAVGVAIERLVLRRIIRRRSPLLNLLIATLGLSIIIQSVAILVWGREPVAYPRIFDEAPVQVLGIRVRSLNLWILGLSLSVMAALQYFFRRTLTGIAWRAASLDPATASLYGVSHRRTVAMTFGISAALGGGAGVLIAPLFFASTGLGYAVIVKSFAAAAIGGYGVVGTMMGGLALGVIETFTAGVVSSAYKNIIVYGLLILLLMTAFRPRLPAGRSITEGPRVAGQALGGLLRDRRARLLGAAVLLAVWAAVGWGGDTYALRVVNMALIAAVAVLGLQMIVGLTGQFSFGHAAFYGVGAYGSALMTMKLGVPFPLALPLSGVAAGVAGLLVAPILRLSGHFLAMATLAMGEIVFLLIVNLKWLTNGAYGIYGVPPPSFAGFEIESDQGYYVLNSIVLLLTYAALHRLVRSRFGRSLVAIRENELAAIACGIPAGRQKVKAFVIGAACAGVAGSLYAHYLATISPDSFTFAASVSFLTMVVIGGLGSLPGGIVGAIVVTLLPEYLRGLAQYRLLVYGGLIVGFMMFLPGGVIEIAGMVAGRFRRRAPA